MRWSICTISHPDRETERTRLRQVLARQIGQRDVEHVIIVGVGEFGNLRQAALFEARGEYVNFVDDDDLVAHDYVETIYPLLDGSVDYVGHRLQLYLDGRKLKPTFHSLRYDGWSEDADGWYRDVAHTNPIRTELARRVPMAGPTGEDYRWAVELARSPHRPRTEHYVDRPLYFYFWSPAHSFQGKH